MKRIQAQYFTSLAIIAILFGCYTAKKADKQLYKLQEKFPEKIAAFARDKYPCIEIPISIDSTVNDEPEIPILVDSFQIPCNGNDSVMTYVITKRSTRTLTINKLVKIRDVADSMQVVTITKQVTKTELGKDRWRTIALVFIGLFLLSIISFIGYVKFRK